MDITHHEHDQITPIAITNWRDIRKTFGIKEKNRRGHMYIVGKTGTGKSSLLGNMAISDIKNGSGIALVDPHGDLSETLLKYIPKERMKDVIYFNPGDLAYPIALNPLEKIHPDFHHLVVSGLISVFKKIWIEFWGPRLEHILRHALFTLLEYPGSTLLDIPLLLTEKEFRMKVVSSITHPHVRAFWFNEFEKYTPWLKSEAVSPILNKMGLFLTSLPLRNIIGQQKNSFRISRVMDEGKILIVNLAKGKIGEDGSSLLGAMLVTEIYLAALWRARIAESERRPFYLYVDEFHSFLTVAFADILSEARKYGLNLVLAHQYIAQLHDKVRDAIFGNVGTMISFRVGIDDAIYLAKEFRPTFDELDLINLPNHSIYLKLMIDGVTSQPFSANTLPFPVNQISDPEKITENSRILYCRKRKEVEDEILKRIMPHDQTSIRQGKLF
ncbi:MAG: type IV secretory system conjugative DNA transfer family protein [Ignavibacteriaceae bacterium]